MTRRELYSALALLHLLVAFTLLSGIRDDQSVLRQAGGFILSGVALAAGVTYSVLGLRERGREGGHGGAGGGEGGTP